MKLHNLLTICIGILFSSSMFAQNQTLIPDQKTSAEPERTYEQCKTEVTQVGVEMEKKRDQKAFQQILQNYTQNRSLRAATHRDYAIQIHIVTRDDGTGGIPIQDVRDEITNFVNPYFTTINTSFIECNPENYINSTEYYQLEDKPEGDAMAAANNVAGVFNIYFVDNADSACGWARFPWNLPTDYIVIANGCATNQSTLVHEIGHYFGLYHTHETANGVESVTRDNSDGCWNCQTAGDLLCDTDADPTLSHDSVTVSASCVYSSNLTDACNGDAYTPDETNIMSYSRKACRDFFSPQQYSRMEFYMDNDRDYLQSGCPCEKPEAKCKDITVNLNAAGNASITPSMVNNNSTWDCGFGSWSVSPNTFDCGDVGANTVTLTVTDALGWVSTCEATVTIEDITDPVINSEAISKTVECDGAGNAAEFMQWLNTQGGATASDACGGTWSHNSTGLSDECGGTGSETVTFTYTDPSNNTATTIATFTVEDSSPPLVTCPDDIHLPECVETATWTVVASDECGDVTIVSDPPSGSFFEKGTTTTVLVTVTDECGNETTCTFEVERDPDLEVSIDAIATSELNTCAYNTDANIILGYGGGPTCIDLNATASGGHGPYTYSWNIPPTIPAGAFTGGNTENPQFCADFQTDHCVTYIFEVVATDIHGCEETEQIEVNVVNAGVFADGSACAMPNNPKVVVCHTITGDPAGGTSICISPSSVPAHLGDPFTIGHDSDCLGDCNAVCVTLSPEEAPSPKTQYSGRISTEFNVNVIPNPFKGETLIEVSADRDTEVKLVIFDLSGKLVESLYEGHMDKDVAYHFHFAPENIPSGVYFARLIGANGEAQYSKMVYIK